MKIRHKPLLIIPIVSTASGFVVSHSKGLSTSLNASEQSRLAFIHSSATAAVALCTIQPADALVKGNAPPPKKGPPPEERKCRNLEECQEQADRAADKAEEEARANMVPASITSKGTRYRDLVDAKDGSPVAKEGDEVKVFYKVLKLGKRSYDGLSGEGTVVFSRGYGLEDDENKAGEKPFIFTIGDNQVIAGLNDAIIGQAVGSVRRFAATPQMGWEKATRECDGGPGGRGKGGELKTDYVVVPTATMVDQEACFDKKKLPFPTTYAQQRRMAQRFDQSLIVEVELVGLN